MKVLSVVFGIILIFNPNLQTAAVKVDLSQDVDDKFISEIAPHVPGWQIKLNSIIMNDNNYDILKEAQTLGISSWEIALMRHYAPYDKDISLCTAYILESLCLRGPIFIFTDILRHPESSSFEKVKYITNVFYNL